jgi:threonine dehydrogenase-like Zn-dependent dehydrogenase
VGNRKRISKRLRKRRELPIHIRWAAKVIAIDADPAELEVARRLGAAHTLNIDETDARAEVEEITNGENVGVSVEAIGGRGQSLKQCHNMVRHNRIMALCGDNYAPTDQFCFHRFHEDGPKIRNLNAVHYTHLRKIENIGEAYRAVFDVDIILENYVSHNLDDIDTVFEQKTLSPIKAHSKP